MKNTKVLIIAEAGVNHNGDLEKAKLLIEVAASSGADFVKFQTFKTDKVVTKLAKRAKYQDDNIGDSESQYEMIKRLELTEEMHTELIKHCKNNNINFLSTGFDLESLQYLNNINIPIFKIPSGEITNLPYLKKIASFGKPIIMSTGMANMDEIKFAFKVLINNGAKQENITILHCNTEYPTPMEDVNLKAMFDIQKHLNTKIGYSDHTLGIEVSIAAVALGAKVIEKHFTLDRNLPGPDHKASLEPNELKEMVKAIRNIEKAIDGSGIKEPSKSERKNILVARKSICINKTLKKGEVIREEDMISLRPCDGLSTIEWNNVIGKKLSKDHEAYISLKKDSIVWES